MSRKLLNLSGISNTDLKLQYGHANLDLLAEYDQNFSNLLRCLDSFNPDPANLISYFFKIYIGNYPTFVCFIISAKEGIFYEYEAYRRLLTVFAQKPQLYTGGFGKKIFSHRPFSSGDAPIRAVTSAFASNCSNISFSSPGGIAEISSKSVILLGCILVCVFFGGTGKAFAEQLGMLWNYKIIW